MRRWYRTTPSITHLGLDMLPVVEPELRVDRKRVDVASSGIAKIVAVYRGSGWEVGSLGPSWG